MKDKEIYDSYPHVLVSLEVRLFLDDSLRGFSCILKSNGLGEKFFADFFTLQINNGVRVLRVAFYQRFPEAYARHIDLPVGPYAEHGGQRFF